MPDFKILLQDNAVHVMDGAYGTLLQERGLDPGESPELFGLRRPDVVRALHLEYLEAGAEILTTNTFGGSPFKLPREVSALELNREMARAAREAAGDRAFVAGSVGPSGHFVRPMGTLSFKEMVEGFAEQIKGLAQGGVDLIKAETHFDLAEARAVVVAARRACDLPVLVSMTFEGGRSLTGTDPLVFVDAMQNMGVEVVAVNCSAGPDQMLDSTARMAPRLNTPLHVQPNAGLPELDGEGKTVFPLGPDEFAAKTALFVDHKAKILGGCCGTGPDHIRALARAVSGAAWQRPQAPSPLVLTTRTESVAIGPGLRPVVIGERINPTGKKDLAAELAQGRFSRALEMAEEQLAAGARVLDVNVGAPGVAESEVLPALVQELSSRHQVPLSIDSSDPEAVALALDACPGTPLVNSISGEEGRLERLGPLCKAYGAPFILLPLEGRKLPVEAADRIRIIEAMLARADAMGIPRRLVMVDALALTVSSKPGAALACLEVIRYCTEKLGLSTVFGLSNISFGLPARDLVNASFAAMCLGQGLCAAITDPNSHRLMQSWRASEVLLNHDPAAERFIAHYAGFKDGGSGSAAPAASGSGPVEVTDLGQAVLAGAGDAILPLLEAALTSGAKPFDLVNGKLIPAIMEVGDKYERKEYFLPQLIRSAETLKKAMERLEPLLKDEAGGEEKPVVVMATVQGDIHDIGKNIVCLMLRNQGFEVEDLGKDVPAEAIVAKAEEMNARIIGLSALMTTTMVRMRETVDLVRERGLDAKVMVGGAVVTEAFAKEIGAHGHAPDAVAAVRLAKKLLQ